MGIKPFIPDKVYEILRWVVCTVIPEIITLYGVIGHVCDIPHTATVLTIMAATEAFLAGIFMFNKIAYDARMKADIKELSECCVDEGFGGGRGTEAEDE